MRADDKNAKWLEVRRQARSGFVGLSNRLVDSSAFAKLTYAPSIKVLVWFWQMAAYAKHKKKPGQDSPVGKLDKILNNGNLSFTYEVARWRGLSNQQFSHALKKLHWFGFIDVKHLGRGIRGDYTKFALSARWQKYGTPEWEEIPFPSNLYEGFRQRPKEKATAENSSLQTMRTHRYKVVESPHNAENSSLKTAISFDSQHRDLTVSVDLARGTKSIDEGIEGKELRGQEVDRTHGRYVATASSPPKQWRPHKSEIRENVTEILRKCPDPRADNYRFIAFITDQLDGMMRQQLDIGRVWRDLQERHDLDTWTVDLLFACLPPGVDRNFAEVIQ